MSSTFRLSPTSFSRSVALESLEPRQLFAAYGVSGLGTLAGYSDFIAQGLNNSGHVVGYAGTATTRAFVSKAGVMTAVAPVGSAALAINNTGSIVGRFSPAGGTFHAFLKQGATLTDLSTKLAAATGYGDPGFPYYGEASDVNASNVVVLNIGQMDDPTTYKYAGSTFSAVAGSWPGKVNDLGTFANDYFDAVSESVKVTKGATTYTINAAEVGGINNQDQIVGKTLVDKRAFLYTPGGAVKKFGPVGAQPTDINNQGIIVGRLNTHTMSSGDDRAFVIRKGVVTDLNTLVMVPAGVVLTEAVGINDKGQIAVNGTKAGKRVSFLLSPTAATASISGFVFNDLNKNKMKNTGEPGLAGWQVYVDSNKSGVWDVGEQIVKTDAAGAYKLNTLTAGTYRIYEVRKDGWTRSNPPGAWPLGFFDVTLASGQLVTGKNFGNWK